MDKKINIDLSNLPKSVQDDHLRGMKLTGHTIKHEGLTLHQIEYTQVIRVKGEVLASAGNIGGYVQTLDGISENVYISPESKVIGIRNEITNTAIKGASLVTNSTIEESSVNSSSVISSKITGTSLEKSVIRCSGVENCTLEDSVVVYSELKEVKGRDASFRRSDIKYTTTSSSHFVSAILGKNNFTVNHITNSQIYEIEYFDGFNINGAVIEDHNDIFVIERIGSRGGKLVLYTDFYKNVLVTAGCFKGTDKEFRERVLKFHGLRSPKHYKQYQLALALAESTRPRWKFKKLSWWQKMIYPFYNFGGTSFDTTNKLNEELLKSRKKR